MLDAILGVCMFFLTDSSFAKNCTFLDINQALAGNIFLVAQNRFCTKLNFLKLQVLRNGFSENCEIELDKLSKLKSGGLGEIRRKLFSRPTSEAVPNFA